MNELKKETWQELKAIRTDLENLRRDVMKFGHC